MSSNELRDVNEFGVTLGSLYIEAQGYVPVLLENLHGMSCSELVGPWVVLGFSVSMEAFDELLLINGPWSRSSLVFSGFGLKAPASGFQSYSYSNLKTSPSIQHQ